MLLTTELHFLVFTAEVYMIELHFVAATVYMTVACCY